MKSPRYLELHASGELDRRIDTFQEILQSCTLCPRQCRINRLEGERGYCRAGKNLVVSSISPHFGEEEPLVGKRRLTGVGGSGTIFLTHCNLGCVYCQNYEISHLGQGQRVRPEELAGAMLQLQAMGCHNINWVTPTHFLPQLIQSLGIAIETGLTLPIVYNCGGYESTDTIALLDGIIDIYMPDIKYSDAHASAKYSDAPDYFERCREAIKEMHRQVGDLKVNSEGIAERGLLIRHLVLPNDLAGSERVLQFIAEDISNDSYVNIMPQYRPLFRAHEYPELDRRPTPEEFRGAIELAKALGLHRGLASAA